MIQELTTCSKNNGRLICYIGLCALLIILIVAFCCTGFAKADPYYNALKAEAKSDVLQIRPGDDVELEVIATCLEGSIYYTWNTQGASVLDDNLTSSRCTLLNINADKNYIKCIVSDDFGNSETVYFNVYVNHFTAEGIVFGNDNYGVINKNLHVNSGENAILTVDSSCDLGEMSYIWTCHHYNSGLSFSGSDIEEDVDGSLLSNGGKTCTVSSVTTNMCYVCKVSDEYGHTFSINHTIIVDSGLAVSALTPSEVYIPLNGQTTLKVAATTDEGDIHYQWFYNQYNHNDYYDSLIASGQIEGATGAAYTTSPLVYNTEYICYVSDDYGNADMAIFMVCVDSGMKVTGQYDQEYSIVHPGDSITVSVNPTVDIGEMTYCWNVHEWDGGLNSGTDYEFTDIGYSYTIESIRCLTQITFTAYDEYGNSYEWWFKVSIDNGFSANPVGDIIRQVPNGESITLAVEARTDYGGISYRWYDEENWEMISTEPTVTVKGLSGSSIIKCDITDEYGNGETIEYTIFWDEQRSEEEWNETEVIDLQLNRTYYVFGTSLFRFLPEASGTYIFTSPKAGESYLSYQLMDEDGSILDNEFVEAGYVDINLGENGYVTQACDLEFEKEFVMGNTYYLMIETKKEMPLRVIYFRSEADTLFQHILTIPTGTIRIESQAFAGLINMDAVMIPSSVQFIADDAFSDCEIVIFTTSGSYAETWAKAHQFTVYVD